MEAVAELDALMSLAAHALDGEGVMCRPALLPHVDGQEELFEARELRHPGGGGWEGGSEGGEVLWRWGL